MKATITIDSDAGTFTMTKGVWSGTFPVSDIPKWLAFYRRQQERFPAYAAVYASDVRVLASLAARVSR